MKPLRLVVLFSAAILTSSIFLSSCTKDSNTPYAGVPGYYFPSPVELYMTGQMTSSIYSAVNLDLQGIEYNTSTEAGITSGWETIEVEQSVGINLLGILNGRSVRLSPNMVAGNVKQIRLKVGMHSSIEKDGESHPLSMTQDLIENGIIINTYQSETGYSGSLWVNLDLTQSIRYDAVENVYGFIPSFKIFDYAETGSIEGYAVPGTSMPTIHVESDPNSRTDMITGETFAENGNQGYFKFVGLPAGIYQVEIVTHDGSDRRKMITQVEVRKRETNNLGLQEIQ